MSSMTLPSPIGPILVAAGDGVVESIRLLGSAAEAIAPVDPDDPLLRETADQLDAWFAHRLTEFALPLAPLRSERGNALREAIRSIPYAQTASYGELARRAASGPRAIGQACRRNPFTIVVPCHRVIGAGQAIGHYSGGDGIATKRWLIAHEQASS